MYYANTNGAMNTILTRKLLETKYITQSESVRSIAKELGFSYSYIQAKIKEYGIPRRPQYRDLTGIEFGKLKVASFCEISDDRQQALWNCVCKCGGSKVIRGSRLTSGEVIDCGCRHRVRVGDISGRHFANIKSHARWRKLDFKINIKDVWELYLQQNKKCALSGVHITFDTTNEPNTTASLDRIDSSKGYILSNVQWVHKDINQMKSNRSDSDFLMWIKTIYLHNFGVGEK
jgi:hypothetical protein